MPEAPRCIRHLRDVSTFGVRSVHAWHKRQYFSNVSSSGDTNIIVAATCSLRSSAAIQRTRWTTHRPWRCGMTNQKHHSIKPPDRSRTKPRTMQRQGCSAEAQAECKWGEVSSTELLRAMTPLDDCASATTDPIFTCLARVSCAWALRGSCATPGRRCQLPRRELRQQDALILCWLPKSDHGRPADEIHPKSAEPSVSR